LYKSQYSNHNYQKLHQYYQTRQTQHYAKIIQTNFNTLQHRDSRYINPPIHLPLVNISITECNPENDIITTRHTIQTIHDSAYLYDQDGRYQHTTTVQRLKWLWTQYHHSILIIPSLEPPLQTFEIEVIWLIHRYKYPKNTQYSLPTDLLKHLLTSFNITHTYFSSPLTCPTHLTHFYSPHPRDCIFGSLGTAFSYKWHNRGFAHHPPSLLPQAIHMARLAAKENPQSYTIIINSYPNWHQHIDPYHQMYPDTHVIAYIPPNTLKYHEPLNPLFTENTHTNTNAIQILCIHHGTSTTRDIEALQQISNFFPNIPILTQLAQPTPPRTRVKTEKNWHILSIPSYPVRTNTSTPHFPNYTFALPQKFPPMYSYYTDGSFKPPKQVAPNTWRPEKASYGIYNPIKDLQISEHLPGLQNILRAELMAIYTAIQLSITTYREEPVYIFTDSLNSLYLINTQLQHPIAHNNHPDKSILEKITEMLQEEHTQPNYTKLKHTLILLATKL
jgi:hypothetical protein